MRLFLPSPITVWAARDILRRPGEAAFLALILAVITVLPATALLLTQAVGYTAERILAVAPAVVVRKFNNGGWAPMPVQSALSAAASVHGALKPRCRLWGVVQGPAGPLTVVALPGEDRDAGLASAIAIPRPGEAILGPGIILPTDRIILKFGAAQKHLTIAGRLDPSASMVAHDLVLVHPGDARELFSIPPGYATDLAVDVFHEQEVEAVAADLADQFPWPVQITTRAEAKEIYAGGVSRRGGIATIVFFPAVLALVFTVMASVRERISRRHEIGLMKALGWETADIVKFQMTRALIICAPATFVGLLLAYGMVFWPGVEWPGRLFFGWLENPVQLRLDLPGVLWVLIEIGILVMVPFLAGALWTALHGAAADPQALIQSEERR